MINVIELVGGIFKPAAELIDNIHTSEEEKLELKAKMEEMENEMRVKIFEYESGLMKAKCDIILAEAKGESFLQRNWRPILMLVITAIVANNYIIAPYVDAIFKSGVYLELPGGLFTLLTIGVGGYVAGRSGEKIMDKFKGGN